MKTWLEFEFNEGTQENSIGSSHLVMKPEDYLGLSVLKEGLA